MPSPKLVVRDAMFPMPHAIDSGASMADAGREMTSNGIRHLPVLSEGRLAGIVTDRDVALIEALPNVDADDVTCGEAMWERPHVVHPTEPLDELVEAMAEQKIDSALVVDEDAVVGVFTVTDALRVLAGLLR